LKGVSWERGAVRRPQLIRGARLLMGDGGCALALVRMYSAKMLNVVIQVRGRDDEDHDDDDDGGAGGDHDKDP
jgi:hypothetical protein